MTIVYFGSRVFGHNAEYYAVGMKLTKSVLVMVIQAININTAGLPRQPRQGGGWGSGRTNDRSCQPHAPYKDFAVVYTLAYLSIFLSSLSLSFSFYTDGSSVEVASSSSFFVPSLKKSLASRLDYRNSCNASEPYAMFPAVDHVTRICYIRKRVFCTDIHIR